MIRVAINGFGRIGRNAFKVAFERDDMEIVAINDLAPIESLAYLLEYDSVYGRFPFDIETKKTKLIVGDKEVLTTSEKDPAKLPWKKQNIDIVLECTGVFRTKKLASAHIKAGARGVIISAPAKDEEVRSCLLGVNEESLTKDDKVIDNASCTTNSVAPVAKVIRDAFGIKKAAMTTIHAYTANQNLIDGSNKDLRRGRAAAQNIIPTSTGAAIATTRILPELQKKFDGIAIRVPVITGSFTDFTFVTKKKTDIDSVKQAFIDASESSEMRDILGVTDDSIVSSDIIGSHYSAIVDLQMINVIDRDLVKVYAWYDNEWGYSNRLIELVEHFANTLDS